MQSSSTEDGTDESRQWTGNDLEDNMEDISADADDSSNGTGESSDSDESDDRSSDTRAQNETANVNGSIDGDKKSGLSDVETRKLLEDIGDCEEYINLQEAEDCDENTPEFNDDTDTSRTVDPFDITDEQIDYYTACFLQLMKETQGSSSIYGALDGSDERVLKFFYKSRLDNSTLARIWSLSDINEDGFLNYNEFVVAMHLLAMHLLLGIPIPSTLPPHFRPTPIPVRQIVSNETLVPQNDDETASNGTSTTTSATTAEHLSATGKSDDGLKFKHQVDNVLSKTCDNDGLKRNVQQFTKYTENLTYGKFATLAPKSRQNQQFKELATGSKHHSLSDDYLHFHVNRPECGMATFSDVPPLIVDSHPRAMATQYAPSPIFLPKKSPPPRLPPRNYRIDPSRKFNKKCHGRSFSLDLKTSTSGNIPTIHQSMSESTNKNCDPLLFEPPNEFSISSSINLCNRKTRGVQTDFLELCGFSDASSIMLKEIDECFDTKRRCELLRSMNEQLETDRATMTQIKLQLQVRIEEIDAQIKEINMKKT